MTNTHTTFYNNISTLEWDGIQSQKFKGNRSHLVQPAN
jgi:hypothetical protein